MCGILGFLAPDAQGLLLKNLPKIENRGYDSCGIALWQSDGIKVLKTVGSTDNLRAKIGSTVIDSSTGIAHTRWPTIGSITEWNAHPHEGDGLVLVHNGTLKDPEGLKEQYSRVGPSMLQAHESDSAILAAVLGYRFKSGLTAESLGAFLSEIPGTFALAIIHQVHPDTIFLVSRGQSIGFAKLKSGDGYAVCSEPMALQGLISDMVMLRDGEVVILQTAGLIESHLFNHPESQREPGESRMIVTITEQAPRSKGFHDTWMSLEIAEQPAVIAHGIEQLEKIRGCASPRSHKYILTGCGSAYHAANLIAYLLRQQGLQVSAQLANNFDWTQVNDPARTTFVILSQSGETLDTNTIALEAKRRRHQVTAFVNRPFSGLQRIADETIPLHCNEEVSVASTKVFLAMVTLGLGSFARLHNLEKSPYWDLRQLPVHLTTVLDDLKDPTHVYRAPGLEQAVQRLSHTTNVYFLGRQELFPLAQEGELKLKEISQIHAEAIPTGELKHGPFALINPRFPCVLLLPSASDRPGEELALIALKEILTRKGDVIVLGHESNISKAEKRGAYACVSVPGPIELYPLLLIPVLQLLAHDTAMRLGRTVDRPPNIAKTVTVE